MAIIGAFTTLYPSQTLFKDIYNPLYSIKKIKEKDLYLSYIVFAEYKYLINEDESIDKVLKQLISKYPNKVEAYLKYWQILTDKKGKFNNYQTAHHISDIYWKNSPSLNFDDNIY